MLSLLQLALVGASLISSTQACLGWEGGLPTPTGTKTNSAAIKVGAGQVYDGGWQKFDRGSGACTGGEGGMFSNTTCLAMCHWPRDTNTVA